MLAFTIATGRGATDQLLQRLSQNLALRGLRCCGTVQINSARRPDGPCDMDVQILPDGPVLRISQDLGPLAKGCRLDPAALENAVGLVSARLCDGADLLIINKFGKHEAQGRGFRDVIAQAMAMGLPVLVGLNTLNQPAFDAFADGLAEQIHPDPLALQDWVTRHVQQNAPAA